MKIPKNVNAILRKLTFKAKKPLNKYKDPNAWLDAVYRNNKKKIDEAYADIPSRLSKKTLFKNKVREYVNRTGDEFLWYERRIYPIDFCDL